MENGGVVRHAVALVVESSGCVGIWRAGRSESQEHALQRPPPGLLYDLRFSGAEFTSWFLVVKATHGSRLKSRPSREVTSRDRSFKNIVQEYRFWIKSAI